MIVVQSLRIPLEMLDRPGIVTARVLRQAQWQVGHDLECQVGDIPSDDEGTLSGRHGIGMPAEDPEMVSEIRLNPSHASSVTEAVRQDFRFLKVVEDAPTLTKRLKGISDFKADVDGVLQIAAHFR